MTIASGVFHGLRLLRLLCFQYDARCIARTSVDAQSCLTWDLCKPLSLLAARHARERKCYSGNQTFITIVFAISFDSCGYPEMFEPYLTHLRLI